MAKRRIKAGHDLSVQLVQRNNLPICDALFSNQNPCWLDDLEGNLGSKCLGHLEVGTASIPRIDFLARPEPLFQCSFLLTADTSAGKEKAARCTPGHLVMLQIVIFDMAGLLVLDLLDLPASPESRQSRLFQKG